MRNIILFQRLIKMIALTYAINQDELWDKFQEVKSIDQILILIREGKIKSE